MGGRLIFCTIRGDLVGRSVFLVIVLETRNYAQINLAVGAMVLGFAPQYPLVAVDRVPAVIAAQCGSCSQDRAVSSATCTQYGRGRRGAWI